MSPEENFKNNLRHHPRLDIHLKADYKVVLHQKGRQRVSFETENISLGGLMFYSDRSIKTGTELEIRLRHDSDQIAFRAKVVWTALRPNPPIPETPYATGLQYFKITTENLDKIRHLAARIVQLNSSSKIQ